MGDCVRGFGRVGAGNFLIHGLVMQITAMEVAMLGVALVVAYGMRREKMHVDLRRVMAETERRGVEQLMPYL